VELYAGGSGIARLAEELVKSGTIGIAGLPPGPITAESLGKAAAGGDPAASRLIEQAGRSLGVAVASLLNAFNPRRVILGGPVTTLGEAYLGPLRAAVAERSMKTPRESVEIVVSDLQDQGLLGAAALILWG
jgi:glucokinase